MNIPVYLYYAIAFLWAWSGIQPVLFAEQESLQLLERVGIGEMFRLPVFYLAVFLDMTFAIGCLTQWRERSAFWLLQCCTVLVYSLIIGFRLPEMWVHPFAPLIKNVPILAILYFLFKQNN
ncbi:DoxX-like family protein [Neisseriaceae bacterium B1]